MIRLRRAYDEPAAGDGYRVLEDRLWPRGVRKADAALDRWMKEVAPSDGLRTWFGHDPEKWEEFRRRYDEELDGRTSEIAFLRQKAEEGPLTLVYGARDTEHNHAVVLAQRLRRALGTR